MLNKVILQGNIGRAPKICLTQEGKKMATFSLATTQTWKDETGEWQSTTDWHSIVVFRDSTIGWIKDVLMRGDPVYVEGKLTYHQWTDTLGQKRSTPHVVIAGREGCVKRLLSRPPASHKNISQSSNLLPSKEESCSKQKDESSDIPLEETQEETPLNTQ
ncbi:MAG TPA: single-stranded DNA-binding protein [Alphaproteobacteria bacterium]|nr:single-stranded DNA-binding protein [Alphaproteobacteria bacterium]